MNPQAKNEVINALEQDRERLFRCVRNESLRYTVRLTYVKKLHETESAIATVRGLEP